MEHDERRLRLNLTERQMKEVLALSHGLVANHGTGCDVFEENLEGALQNAAQTVARGGKLGDDEMARILSSAESMHVAGDRSGYGEEILDVIGGKGLVKAGSRKFFWAVPNVWGLALDETKDWNPEQWMKDVGPFWVFGIWLLDDNVSDYLASSDRMAHMLRVGTEVVFWTDLLSYMREYGRPENHIDQTQNKVRDWFDEHVPGGDAYRSGLDLEDVPHRCRTHIGSPKTRWSDLEGESEDEKYNQWTDDLLDNFYWDSEFRLDSFVLDSLLLECQELPGGSGYLTRHEDVEKPTSLTI